MKIFKSIVLILGILGSILYVGTCLTPYINPEHGYFFTFAGLLFPIGLIIMICWCFISLLFYRKYSWIFFLVLLAGYQNIIAIFGFKRGNHFEQAKSKNSIRILSWNVNNFLSGSKEHADEINEMLDFMKKSNADIICFQDYSSIPTKEADASTENIKLITGLPYSFFSEADKNYGVIIFSKWPFLKQTGIPFLNANSLESLQWVDIQMPNQVLRVYNTHLLSMNMHVELMEDNKYSRLKFVQYDTAIFNHRDKLSRMAYFDKMHTKQAELIKKSLDSCNQPFIFTADMNSVPSSYVYHHIRAGLKDAFLENGWGFGRTYDSLSPTLRIDVLLTSKSIKTIQYQSPHLHLSDHYPIITDIQIKP